MIRRTLTLAAVAATAIGLCAAPAGAASTAAAKYTAGAGYVPKLDTLGRTHMTVVVPTVPCGKNAPDSAVTVGMFGSVRTGSHKHRWQVAVRVQCHNGGRSARANFGGFNHGGGMRVHVGDVVVLTQDSAISFGINDRTSGQGEGGGSVGGHAHPSTRVLFGARFTGTPSKPFPVKVRNATAHGTPIGKQHPSRHTQRRHNGNVVASAGAIRPSHRSFEIAVR